MAGTVAIQLHLDLKAGCRTGLVGLLICQDRPCRHDDGVMPSRPSPTGRAAVCWRFTIGLLNHTTPSERPKPQRRMARHLFTVNGSALGKARGGAQSLVRFSQICTGFRRPDWRSTGTAGGRAANRYGSGPSTPATATGRAPSGVARLMIHWYAANTAQRAKPSPAWLTRSRNIPTLQAHFSLLCPSAAWVQRIRPGAGQVGTHFRSSSRMAAFLTPNCDDLLVTAGRISAFTRTPCCHSHWAVLTSVPRVVLDRSNDGTGGDDGHCWSPASAFVDNSP